MKKEQKNIVYWKRRYVSKEDTIFYFRNVWGNAAAGTYWTKGTYKWQALIDGVLIS